MKELNSPIKNRSFLKILDFTPEELQYLVDLAAQLKKEKKNHTEDKHLVGKNFALVFEKASTRTRSAFAVAAYDQGATVTLLNSENAQIGIKESVRDSARVLGRMFDGIEYRGYAQKTVEEIAEYSKVPVWNGLTDESHPTQIIADFLTMIEHSGKALKDITFCYIGDARYNMGNSLLAGGAKMGMDVRIISPAELQPSGEIVEECKRVAAASGAKITITDDIESGLKGCDFIYTDMWVSMGEPYEIWKERIDLLMPYQVTMEKLAMTGNPNCKFMHCLPAFHDTLTKVSHDLYEKYGVGKDGLEVTDEVFESEASIVFDEAENRLHSIKAIMVATAGE